MMRTSRIPRASGQPGRLGGVRESERSSVTDTPGHHLRAARTFEEAAERHEAAARISEREGDSIMADVERRDAQANRVAAQRELELAAECQRGARDGRRATG